MHKNKIKYIKLLFILLSNKPNNVNNEPFHFFIKRDFLRVPSMSFPSTTSGGKLITDRETLT